MYNSLYKQVRENRTEQLQQVDFYQSCFHWTLNFVVVKNIRGSVFYVMFYYINFDTDWKLRALFARVQNMEKRVLLFLMRFLRIKI